jgi:hypothetical protein
MEIIKKGQRPTIDGKWTQHSAVFKKKLCTL